MVTSAYIHIPFCKSKCKYCSFISFPETEKKDEYLSALEKEINFFYKNEKLKTLYFGGGTPSLLEIKDFQKLLALFNINEQTEITAELNPETLTPKYMLELKKTGINRISLGCQTFDDKILKLIGRRHNANQVMQAVEFAQNAGFDNVSLDFIYGLPTQTTEGFKNDLEIAISLGIQHISLYGLKIEEGCFFFDNMPKDLPDEDIQADMYLNAIETLKDFGHYEISNFGKPSKHNLIYWNNENYYGFGTAAHGYLGKMRYSNVNSIDEYIKNPLKHENETVLTQQEQLEEEIFLGFRKMSGINITEINNKYNINFEKRYKTVLSKYNNFFIKTENKYAFNKDGILISNVILADFLQ